MKRLRDYEPVLSQLMLWMARDTRFRCRPGLGQIIADNPRLVLAISHGSPLSWLPSISLLAAHLCARGGGDRRPIGVMDRVFFQMPLVKRLAQMITQTERPLSLAELADAFHRGQCTDLVVFPEGSNCFFGEPAEIQEFRSPKFVEIAIRAEAPILVCVHRGSENWAVTLPVEEEVVNRLDWLPKAVYDFAERRLRKTGLFALPLLPAPMEKFEMLCELYVPTLTLEDLSEDPLRRHEQIRQEAERVRSRMLALALELDQAETAKSHTKTVRNGTPRHEKSTPAVETFTPIETVVAVAAVKSSTEMPGDLPSYNTGSSPKGARRTPRSAEIEQTL